jgi:glutamate formiminotransferase / 5-formyltetrahydrofolate cyclo-ligase
MAGPSTDTWLESVINISEGRDMEVLDRLSASVGRALLDRHSDADHHRSVFTLAGPAPELMAAARRLSAAAVEALDLTDHSGAHPRFGVIDVVPFVPLGGAEMADAAELRDGFAEWAGRELGLPCFLYGPLAGGGSRSLPEVRRDAFGALSPDTGPTVPHPTAGAVAVGAREAMVAYNLWLDGQDVTEARRLAGALRGPAVRALGFELSGGAQLSFNLLEPLRTGPDEVYDRAVALGARIGRAELVGLAPAAALDRIPSGRWAQLGLDRQATIEARLARTRPSGGSALSD